MNVDCWIQQVTTRVGAVTCWIQQSALPKQVVGFSCLLNSEVGQLISKVAVTAPLYGEHPRKWIAPALGVGVGAAYKGPLKGRFKGPFKGRIRPSEGSDGRNAEW